MNKSIKNLLISITILLTTNCFAKQDKIEKTAPIVIEIVGKGKPVLYLPGFTNPGLIWQETLENLNFEHKSYLVSYAGFNGNKAIKMPWYSTIKDALIAYIKENKMYDILIVGHSMGGNLAIDIASELPNRVSKMIIVDSLPCMRDVMMPNVPAESLFYDSPYNKRTLKMDDDQFKTMAKMMASNMTYQENKKEKLANWILEADRETYVYGYTDLLKLDLRNKLKNIKCNTLVVGASFPDVKVAKENFEKQYSNLSNKKIVMASKSKHFVMLDQPEWFYKIANEFLMNAKK